MGSWKNAAASLYKKEQMSREFEIAFIILLIKNFNVYLREKLITKC